MSCRVLLVDDHDVVRLGLRALLRSLPDVIVCGESADGLDAIEKAYQLKPNIIIMDLGIPRANGVIVAQRLLASRPGQKVLIFGEVESGAIMRTLLHAGIQGWVSKTDPALDILSAVEALQLNRMYFTALVGEVILDEYLHAHIPSSTSEQLKKSLTLREKEVTQLLAEGKATKEIATILGISFRTAATHRMNLMRKLRVHNIAELTLYAVSHQMVEAPVFKVLAEVGKSRARAAHENAAQAAA